MIASRASKQVVWFCLVPALAGTIALLGWTLGNETLKSISPGRIAMNPVSALCFIVLAAALWLVTKPSAHRRRVSLGLALAVSAIGGLKLASYIFRFDFFIDRSLFVDSLGTNRMAPNTSLCFLLSGAAIAGIDRLTPRGRWPAQMAVIAVATLSLVSLIGYSYQASALYRMGSYVPMAINTATAFGVLSLGILLARPHRGVVAVILDRGAGGVMARRLLPAVIIIPWLLGALRLFGQHMEYYDTEFGAAMLVAVTATLFVITVGWIAGALTRSDAERKQAMDELQRTSAEIARLNEELEQRVADRTTELSAANADLEQKNRENEMFVYSASHDLRSPLVNLQGFSHEIALVTKSIRQLITEGNWTAETSERGLKLIDVDMQRCIHFIQSAVSRLDAIIDALLRLSRLGRVEYRPQWIETNQVVARILEGVSTTLFDRGVAIEVAELPACWCDPTAIEQVFANLIGNSVNYLDPARPGTIEVGSLPNDESAGSAPASTVFYVKDNGLGINPAYHSKIFQALKRLHPEVAKGEGIGLAIVKRIVARHGGEIWFESAHGVGTTFFVKLPNSSATPELASVRRETSKVRSSHDDQSANRHPVGRG